MKRFKQISCYGFWKETLELDIIIYILEPNKNNNLKAKKKKKRFYNKQKLFVLDQGPWTVLSTGQLLYLLSQGSRGTALGSWTSHCCSTKYYFGQFMTQIKVLISLERDFLQNSSNNSSLVISVRVNFDYTGNRILSIISVLCLVTPFWQVCFSF